ncbi:endonuclease domain-containing protein [Methylobacterium trifolii]|uniref:DUF559 domain-containing protein n=1 Tax=Methylobacterium trifolii TaxID=1003092 RepID=A0ABQ4U5C5_9HYPH|nr:DUF559 domain-containing protein [Methylobacterium trifolii]GJE61010.1 hypothetical protein MPOCJGCO_3129 [Methylobacterium trifolii]
MVAETRPQITGSDLARKVAGLARGERLVVLGIGREGIGAIVSEDFDRDRSVLLVTGDNEPTATAVVDRLLDDLAELALDRWPRWHGLGKPTDPVVADPWLKAASRRAERGLPPRFRRLGQERELCRLLDVLDQARVVLVWEVDPVSAAHARPVIDALEWCGRHGVAVVAALAAKPPETAPYDRVLYGARVFARTDRAVAKRFIAPAGAHHASVIEQQVAESLARDVELKDLFVCNAPVLVGAWGGTARVDLLCSAHRIVVELDGPEHRAEPKFGNDRHRDYELLTAGYVVLRLTNDQVAADLPLAIEKIRTVVRLRRGTTEGEP